MFIFMFLQAQFLAPNVCINDSKINEDGLLLVGLIILSAARSGCGIIPTTLPSLLHTPAICSTEPLT